MTDHEPEAPFTEQECVASAAWLHSTGGVLRGLTHALGNRVHAFEMLLSSIEPEERVTRDFVGLLGAESGGCAELVRLYRLMNFAPGAETEACRLPDLVPDAILLWQHDVNSDNYLWTVHVQDGLPAVLAPPAALTQALLVLLLGHTRRADPHAPLSLGLEIRGEADGLVAEFSSTPSGETADTTGVVAAEWLLRSSHATVVQSAHSGRTVTALQLPSLASARLRERRRQG